MSKEAVMFISLLIYRVIILGGTAYLVFSKGASGWWFLLAIICCGSYTYSNGKEL